MSPSSSSRALGRRGLRLDVNYFGLIAGGALAAVTAVVSLFVPGLPAAVEGLMGMASSVVSSVSLVSPESFNKKVKNQPNGKVYQLEVQED